MRGQPALTTALSLIAGLCINAASINPRQTAADNTTYSSQIVAAKLDNSRLPHVQASNGVLPPLKADLFSACQCGDEPLDPRDYYLNTLGVIYNMAKKEPPSRGPDVERPRFISQSGAQKVAIMIGGGPDGNEDLARRLFVEIMFEMMKRNTLEYGMFNLRCTFQRVEGGPNIARYDARVRLAGQTPEQFQVPQTAEIDDGPLWDTAVSVNSATIKNAKRQASDAGDASLQARTTSPRLVSTWAENSVIGIAALYVPLAAVMYALTPSTKTDQVEEVDLSSPEFAIRGKIASTKRPWDRTKRPMDVHEIIDSLYFLTLEANVRGHEGKAYCAVTSQIWEYNYDTQVQGKKLGALSIQKAGADVVEAF